MHVSEKIIHEMELLYVKALSFPEGITEAWQELEKDLSDKSGRKFFGLSRCVNGEMQYLAAMNKMQGDEKRFPELAAMTLPEGKWACTKIPDWRSRIPEIGPTFAALEKGKNIDPARPFVEFYRSSDELQLWVPVL